MSPSFYLGATGFGLMAVCYGLARYAFGLFLPQIDSDLALSPTISGLISGGSFLGYCMAIVLSAYLTERLGPRTVAIAASAIAAVGMAGIAVAPSSAWLAVAVTLAGSSTGLASPPMAAAVSAIVSTDRQDSTNTIINAGTSVGIIASGPVALFIAGQWRLAFAAFAVVAVAIVVASWFWVPKGMQDHSSNSRGLPQLNPELRHLIVAAFLAGVSSTALWSFGGKLVSLRLSWGDFGAGLLWTAIGVAGIVGAGAGTMMARVGTNAAHRLWLAAMATGTVFVGCSFTTPILAMSGGLLFGAAYITLSGIYLVWGVSALPERPATGLMVGFLTIAIGQTAGAPLFGLLMDHFELDYVVAVFAGLALVAGLAQAGERDNPA